MSFKAPFKRTFPTVSQGAIEFARSSVVRERPQDFV